MKYYSILFLVLGYTVAVWARGFPDPPIFAAVQHFPSICYLPPDSGLCSNKNDNSEESDLLIRYYFDMTTEQCYPFGVQNCGGNENRFSSRAACQNFCKLDNI